MRHYRIFDWVDYARGVVPEDERAAMRSHLEQSCVSCGQLADFCESLVRTTAGMASLQVPESLVRRAGNICPKRVKRFFRIPIELVYDSFLNPVPVGLRATWQVGWQALYRAGDCSLDVRIEPDLGSLRAALIGQLVNHATPELRMCGMPVRLTAGRRVVAETESNQFGEFQMEYEQQGRLQLCIEMEGGTKRIVAPLRSIASQEPDSTGNLAISPARKRKQRTNKTS